MNERRNGDAIVEIDLQFSCLQRILKPKKVGRLYASKISMSFYKMFYKPMLR